MRKTSKFGVWDSLGNNVYGTHTPDLTHPSYSPSGSEKASFYSWAIGPHLGEIWNFEIDNRFDNRLYRVYGRLSNRLYNSV